MDSTPKAKKEVSVLHELSSSQLALFTYISSLTCHSQDSKDILQETNLHICRRIEEYDVSRPFLAWAKAIAFYEVRTWRLHNSRNRLVFDNEALESVAASLNAADEEGDERLAYLPDCLSKLPSPWRKMVEDYYYRGKSVKDIAGALGKTGNAVSLVLLRSRNALADCIRSAGTRAKEGGKA